MEPIKAKQHNYGLDAYRCLAAFLVVLVHCTNVSVCPKNTWQEGTLWFLHLLSLCCVNCFGLLTGYLGGSLKHRFSSFLRLWLQVLFYLVILFVLTNSGMLGTEKMMKRKLFPVLGGEYWYFTAYTLVVALLPLLEKGIDALSKQEFKIVILSVLSMSVLPSILPWGPLPKLGFNYGFSAIWLVVLYLTGAYLRKNTQIITENKWLTPKKCLIAAIFLPIMGALLHQCFYAGLIKNAFFKLLLRHIFCVAMYDAQNGEYCMMYYTHPLIFFESIFLLLALSNMKLPFLLAKFMNTCAPYSFGVYLAHCNDPFTYLIREPILQWCTNFPQWTYPFLLIFVVFSITIGCGIIDCTRSLLFKIIGIRWFISRNCQRRLLQKKVPPFIRSIVTNN